MKNILCVASISIMLGGLHVMVLRINLPRRCICKCRALIKSQRIVPQQKSFLHFLVNAQMNGKKEFHPLLKPLQKYFITQDFAQACHCFKNRAR